MGQVERTVEGDSAESNQVPEAVSSLFLRSKHWALMVEFFVRAGSMDGNYSCAPSSFGIYTSFLILCAVLPGPPCLSSSLGSSMSDFELVSVIAIA